MNKGTKSILFGAHQFLLHPLFVAAAWTRLYGFPTDWRLWLCFFVHDLGYWGLKNMDDEVGEEHPYFGASILRRTVARLQRKCTNPSCREGWVIGGDLMEGYCLRCKGCESRFQERDYWHDMCLFHSRFLAKRFDRPFSKLCVADKLAPALTPAWLYVPMTMLTGEIWEYMTVSKSQTYNPWQWFRDFQTWARRWSEENKGGGYERGTRHFYEESDDASEVPNVL